MVLRQLQDLGRRGIHFISQAGYTAVFLVHALVGKPKPIANFKLLIPQLFSVGVFSLVIIVVSALFIGMVLGLQGYTILVKFSAEQALGQLVALSLVRELGPVVSALLFAGRAGSAIT
ncbi:MAG TPA: ABC transporter permease, partial [Gammaproteobacteria bacterium]|nr:ABC transporter permease [Gammaproteobacteria bacterium]